MLFRGFSAYPGLFYPRYFSRSTKPAPPSLGLAAETGQHRLSPALCCVLPHPLQNRVPRVQVLLPLPKKSGIAAAVPDFFVSEQKDLAARCARRLSCGACRGGLQPCGLRPGPTEPADETESGLNVIAFFADVLIRYHLSSPALIPSSTQNAPGFAFFGLFRVRFLFFAAFWPQNFRLGFCATCRIASTS